jgi:hypothetical protein
MSILILKNSIDMDMGPSPVQQKSRGIGRVFIYRLALALTSELETLSLTNEEVL